MSRYCIGLTLFLVLIFAGGAAGQHVMATISVGNAPLDLVYDSINNKIFVANEGMNTVSVIDPDDNQVTATIAVGEHPSAICWNATNDKIYTGNNILAQGGTVTVIDAGTNSVISTVSVGNGPTDILWNPTQNKVYCICRDNATVTVIDGASDEVIASIGLGQTFNEILYNPTNDYCYVSSGAYREPGKVYVIDCADDVFLFDFNSGSNAYAMAHNPVNNRLYVTNIGSANLAIMNCINHSNMGMLSTGEEPRDVLWTPDNRVFVSSYWGQKVWYMHGDSLRFRGAAGIAGNPHALIYIPHTQKLFATMPLQSQVAVIDARPGHESRVIDYINVGSGPVPLALCPADTQLYVGNSWGNTVTVIKDVIGVEERPANRPRARTAVRAHPNPTPAGGAVLFSISGFVPERLEVWNAAGQLVTGTPATGDLTVAAPTASGLYLYRFSSGDRAVTGKLIVE